jgi:Na+(H+)/acetate symporter ActP
LPVIVLSLFWKRFNTSGAVCGLASGLLASLVLIALSPSIMKVDPPTVVGAARHLIQRPPIFPLENPGILSIPLGFLGAILGTYLRRERPKPALTSWLSGPTPGSGRKKLSKRSVTIGRCRRLADTSLHTFCVSAKS